MWFKAKKRALKILRVAKAVARGQTTFYPPQVEEFERAFAKAHDKPFGLTFCNGTSALEAAVFGCKVGPGDEVLVPSYTFHASISPILLAGAKPVYVDICPRTLTVDADDLERKVTSRTAAIMVVHIWGNPAPMARIQEIANRNKLKIIEDCSHAHGARFANQLVGTFGAVGCFSLQGNKPVNAGEGGIAITSDEEIFERMLLFGHFGRKVRGYPREGRYEGLSETGYGSKRRAHPLGIILAAVDFELLNEFNKRMSERESAMRAMLKPYAGALTPMEIQHEGKRGGFYPGLPIFTKKEARGVINALQSFGIDARGHPYGKFHTLPHMSDPEDHRGLFFQSAEEIKRETENFTPPLLPATDAIYERTLFLPIPEVRARAYFKRLEKGLRLSKILGEANL